MIFKRIKDRQFLKLFLKNWLLVFACIVLPIVFCVVSIHHFAAQSLLKEMDVAATRSLSNTKATTDSLLKEICNNLLNKAMDENLESFISKKRNEPKPYDYVSLTQLTKQTLEENYRESLYYSVDVYTEVGDYIVTAFRGASSYNRALDPELIDIFYDLASTTSPGSLCVIPRVVGGQRLLTIYYIKSVVPERRSFLSVSIYTDEFIKYLSGTSDYEHGYSLLLDKEGKVLLDTSGVLYDSMIPLEDIADTSSKGYVVNGVEMRTSWMPALLRIRAATASAVSPRLLRTGLYFWKVRFTLPEAMALINAPRMTRMYVLSQYMIGNLLCWKCSLPYKVTQFPFCVKWPRLYRENTGYPGLYQWNSKSQHQKSTKHKIDFRSTQ